MPLYAMIALLALSAAACAFSSFNPLRWWHWPLLFVVAGLFAAAVAAAQSGRYDAEQTFVACFLLAVLLLSAAVATGVTVGRKLLAR
jgi:hypothetical protein